MERASNELLHLRSDTAVIVSKSINMDKKGDMTRAVDILREWVKMQPHFKKKDYTEEYLESFIISTKGSIEKAKKRLDKMCTMRTLLPQFFEVYDVSKDFGNLFDIMSVTFLPKLTEEHYRVFIVKAHSNFTEASHYTNFYRLCIYMAEYLKLHDCVDSFLLVQDLSAFDMMKFISKLNPVELRQALSITMECYGMKVKGIHFISPSKAIEVLVGIVKQILKPKIASRIHVHKTCEEIHDIVGKEALPVEFGGHGKSIKEINDDWIKVLSSEKYMKYLRLMSQASTDESLRPRDKFNEDYAGMPGTFRIMTVD